MSVVLQTQQDDSYEPSKNEVEEYGKWLGLSLPDDEPFLWIAREGLKAPLPDNWKACKSEKGELYYFNFKSGQSIWDHPMDEYYKDLFKQEKNRHQLLAANELHELHNEDESDIEMPVSTLHSISSEDTENDTGSAEMRASGAVEQLCNSKVRLNAEEKKIHPRERPAIPVLPASSSKTKIEAGTFENGTSEQRKTNIALEQEFTPRSGADEQIVPSMLESNVANTAKQNDDHVHQEYTAALDASRNVSQVTAEKTIPHNACAVTKPESILKPSSLKAKAALRVTFSHEVEDSTNRKPREKNESSGGSSQHKKEDATSVRKEGVRANLEREFNLFKISETERYEKLKAKYTSELDEGLLKSKRELDEVFTHMKQLTGMEQSERISIEATEHGQYRTIFAAHMHQFQAIAAKILVQEIDTNIYSRMIEAKRTVAHSIEEDMQIWQTQIADELRNTQGEYFSLQTAVQETTHQMRYTAACTFQSVIEEAYNTFVTNVGDTYARAQQVLTSTDSQLQTYALQTVTALTRDQISRQVEDVRNKGEMRMEEERERFRNELRKLREHHEHVLDDERVRLDAEQKRKTRDVHTTSTCPPLDDAHYRRPTTSDKDPGLEELDVSGKTSVGTGRVSAAVTELPSVSPASPAERTIQTSSRSQLSSSFSNNESCSSAAANKIASSVDLQAQLHEQAFECRTVAAIGEFSDNTAHDERETMFVLDGSAHKTTDVESRTFSHDGAKIRGASMTEAIPEERDGSLESACDVADQKRRNSSERDVSARHAQYTSQQKSASQNAATPQSTFPLLGAPDAAQGEFRSAVTAVVMELLQGVPLLSHSTKKPLQEENTCSVPAVSHATARRDISNVAFQDKARGGATSQNVLRAPSKERHQLERNRQWGAANGTGASQLKSCVRFSPQLNRSDGPLTECYVFDMDVGTTNGTANNVKDVESSAGIRNPQRALKYLPISSSLADQESMIDAEAARLSGTKEFLVSQRGFLEECRVKLKQARHQWKEDVLVAKRDGVDANSRKGQLLHKRRETLDMQMSEYLEDDAVLRDTELWLETKEKRLQSLRTEIARQEATLLANGDMSACSIETATLVSNYFGSNAHEEYPSSGPKGKGQDSVYPSRTPMNPRLSKTLDRIEKRLKEVTNMIHTTHSHSGKRVTTTRSPETRPKARNNHIVGIPISDIVPRPSQSLHHNPSPQPGRHIRFVDPWKAELR